MKNFEEAIAPYIGKKFRTKTIKIGEVKKRREYNTSRNSKKCVTPLGEFNSCYDAAMAHKVSRAAMSVKLRKNEGGYYYV